MAITQRSTGNREIVKAALHEHPGSAEEIFYYPEIINFFDKLCSVHSYTNAEETLGVLAATMFTRESSPPDICCHSNRMKNRINRCGYC
jgi:hypothetical protein